MKLYNVTAQVYNLFDPYKQTILDNLEIAANSTKAATDLYYESTKIKYHIIKIYSVEEIF